MGDIWVSNLEMVQTLGDFGHTFDALDLEFTGHE